MALPKVSAATFSSLAKSSVIHMQLFLLMAGFGCYSISKVSGVYQKVCFREADRMHEPREHCGNSTEFRDLAIASQKANSQYNMINSLSHSLFPIPMAMILGSMADRIGRKPCMLYGLLCVSIQMYLCTICFSIDALTTDFLLIADSIISFGGAIMLFMSAVLSYVNDTIKDRKNVALSITLCMTCAGLGFMVGNFISSALLKHHVSFPNIVNVSNGIVLLAALWTQLAIQDVRPAVKPAPTADEPGTSTPAAKTSFCQNLWIQATVTSRDIVHTFTIKRPYKKRRLLLICLFGYATLSVQSMSLDNIFTLYVRLKPFLLDDSEISRLSGVISALALVGSTVGILLFRYFHVPDSIVILAGAVSVALKYAFAAAAQNKDMLFLVPLGGCLTSITVGAMQAVLTSLVEPEEAGKVITAKVIVMEVCGLVSGLTFNPVYEHTVDFFPGMIFIINAGCAVLGFFIFFFLHFKVRRIRRKEQFKSQTSRAAVLEEGQRGSVDSGLSDGFGEAGDEVINYY